MLDMLSKDNDLSALSLDKQVHEDATNASWVGE